MTPILVLVAATSCLMAFLFFGLPAIDQDRSARQNSPRQTTPALPANRQVSRAA